MPPTRSERITPPATVRIGPHEFKVTVDKKRANDATITYGHMDAPQAEILINPDQAATQMRDTVLHEILHVITDVACVTIGGDKALIRSDDDEERLVRSISPLLLCLLRDNPDLVTYLTAP